MYERVAAVDVAKASGVVCLRTPDPARPGAAPVPGADGHAGEHLGLLADLVLRAGDRRAGGAAGQPVAGEEPQGAAEDGQAGRDVAGPADPAGAAAAVVRAAGRDPAGAGLHPGPAGPGR